MITQDQARVLELLAIEGCEFYPETGEIKSTIGPLTIAEAADAIEAIGEVAKGDPDRERVIALLRDLPSLGEELDQRVTEALAIFEADASGRPSKTTMRRGKVSIDVDGWIPRDVFEALVRIAKAALRGKCEIITTPLGVAYAVEAELAHIRARLGVLGDVHSLLCALDPDRVGEVTSHEVQIATETVLRLLAERREPTEDGDLQTRMQRLEHRVHRLERREGSEV